MEEQNYSLKHLQNPDFKSKLESKLATPLDSIKDDGMFFVEYDEFRKHFDDLSISLYMNNATHKF